MTFLKASALILVSLCTGLTVCAQNQPRPFLPETAKTINSITPNAVPGCPNQGGILDSISVPVGQPLSLSVVIGAPAPEGGAVFRLSSDNPAFVAAGDTRQGFLPIVTIPEGQTVSNRFTIFGISVGQTLLRITPLTPGFVVSAFPLGAWDVNKSGAGINQKFLDANNPTKACRDAGASTLTTNPALQAMCGLPVQGVASDGVNALLLRTVSGLTGTGCFEIVSTSSLDQGTVQTPLTTTQPVSGLNYGFSYYTPPGFYGDASESRTITVEFTFTPNIGNGNTSRLRAQTKIVRPPVMLIHGVWSDGSGWNDGFVKNDQTRTTYAGDYKSTNGSAFSTNQTRVQGYISQALTNFRRKGYGGTQADVIGHSMGGLLTRLFAGSANYLRPDNLNKGDVHRLITLDTPHFGSNFANLLVGLHRVNPSKAESTVSGITGGSIVNGAVCDLSENSPALQVLAGGTTLRSQVITGTGGPAGTPANPAQYWGGATFFGIKSFESALTERYCTNWINNPGDGPPVCTNFAFHFPQATVDGFRFREMNDAVVPLSSQQGGLGGVNFTEYIHFHIPGIPGVQRGITDGANVATRAFQILEGPDSGLASALPGVLSNGAGTPRTVPGRGAPFDQQDYTNQCGPGGPMRGAANPLRSQTFFGVEEIGKGGDVVPAAVDPRVTLTSPAAGIIFNTGDTVNMVVELAPPLTAFNTVGATLENLTHVSATLTSGLSFSASFVVPPAITGSLTITPDFTDTDGNHFTGAPVVVGIRPTGTPETIALQQHNFLVAPDAPNQQLYLNGTYADGSVLDLTSPFTGTTYTSSNESVVTVNGDGLVQIVGEGFGSIAARSGSLSDFATFVVEDPASPLAPADLTGQVTISRSGFRLDRVSGFFVQDLRITNTSTATLPASLYLVFSGLTPGVTLVNKSGLTEALLPVGSSYLTIPLPGEGLSLPPGGSAQFTLQFLNPDRNAINYSLNLFRTSVAP